MIQLEEIDCPLCNSSDYRVFLKTKDFRFKISDNIFKVVRCNQCGFIFLNPRPLKSEINNFYPSDFNRQDRSFLYKIIEPCFEINQESIIKFIKKYKKNGKILDIGCGNGEFLSAMHKNDYDVWGIELNQGAARFCDRSIKDKILYQELEECNFEAKTFDIITIFQSLEHIYDLNGLFREINRILKEDGILYLSVPNADFFESRFFGPYAYNLEVPRHLYFFTKETISNLLSKNGFGFKIFLRESIFEFVSTPASFYHSLWNFLSDKGMKINSIIKSLTFIPLVIVRFLLRIFFIFQNQNLKLNCQRCINKRA